MNTFSKVLTSSFVFTLLLVLSGASLADNAEEIRYRVQKVGKLNINTGAAPAQASAAQTGDEAPKSAATNPADLYQTNCFACHGTGAAGAPVLGDKAAWEARIAQGEETLLSHALAGFNAMPPRGGTALEDDNIKLIVTYMIENSQ